MIRAMKKLDPKWQIPKKEVPKVEKKEESSMGAEVVQFASHIIAEIRQQFADKGTRICFSKQL
jgi:hypothetical protein